MKLILNFIKQAGMLRLLLALLALVIICFAPFAGKHAIKEGWAMVPTIIVPALVPIVFFVLWLDVLMASVFRADAVGDEDKRQRFGMIVKVDIILVAVLTLSWLPFFYTVVAV